MPLSDKERAFDALCSALNLEPWRTPGDVADLLEQKARAFDAMAKRLGVENYRVPGDVVGVLGGVFVELAFVWGQLKKPTAETLPAPAESGRDFDTPL